MAGPFLRPYSDSRASEGFGVPENLSAVLQCLANGFHLIIQIETVTIAHVSAFIHQLGQPPVR